MKTTIDRAAEVLGHTWPLYSFVASNPLSGLTHLPFNEALQQANSLFHTDTYPRTAVFHQAWDRGEIDKDILTKILLEHNIKASPQAFLERLPSDRKRQSLNPNAEVDRIMVKWLSSFLDEGLAEWDMPFKSEGFYTAWRYLAIYDSSIGKVSLREIPKTATEALEELMAPYNEAERISIFQKHLTALPGYTGYIIHRSESNSPWHEKYPITLADYLAVRLWLTNRLGEGLEITSPNNTIGSSEPRPEYLLLKAWEQSWQLSTARKIENNMSKTDTQNGSETPDAQFVFCIDTRSEAIRRHVEAVGPYETFGYAGFFGIAMDYVDPSSGVAIKSCPPIVQSGYHVTEQAAEGCQPSFDKYLKGERRKTFFQYFLRRMKNLLPSGFGYVESTGLAYGLMMIARTVGGFKIKQWIQPNNLKMEQLTRPVIHSNTNKDRHSDDLPSEEQAKIVKTAFHLLGWDKFAPLVIFVGHGSHSANNPFGSSLDCGACAASRGRHNARMLANLANREEVRNFISGNYGIDIPKDTLFIGAEHNTTTDEIVLFDGQISDSYTSRISEVKRDLHKVQINATSERLATADGISAAMAKANRWSETRPEWGLAGNAGFIIGPRALSKGLDLEGRCFLHSYNWALDPEGSALEGIMQGPMVVTQWINNHYYFSTVANETFGGGNKTTHNITGKYSVVQGNGSDLRMGLPLQSVFDADDSPYHSSLRLSVLIQAPLYQVESILERNTQIKSLFDNEWIYLMVMDPLQGNTIIRYQSQGKWSALTQAIEVDADTESTRYRSIELESIFQA